MHPDQLLVALLGGLGLSSVSFFAWLRARRRIRDLEMTLLANSADTDRYEELLTLLQQVAARTEDLADQQSQLARRLAATVEHPPLLRPEPPAQITPH